MGLNYMSGDNDDIGEKKVIISYSESFKIIDELVEMYNIYSSLSEKADLLSKNPELNNELLNIKEQMKKLGDSMFFPNPIIWIGYKFKAYINSNNAIITLNDLRNHCKSPTYICSKRFNFLNKGLKMNGLDLLDNHLLDGNTILSDLISENSKIRDLCLDQNFMSKRDKYEYFKKGGKVSKWENYLYIDFSGTNRGVSF